jgi:hypothetical protein
MFVTARCRRVWLVACSLSVGVLTPLPPAAVAKDPIARELLGKERIPKLPVSPQPVLRPSAPAGKLAVMRLTERWFESRIGGDVVEQSPVDQVILNTRVRGTAQTSARPAVKLQEDPQRASLQVVFTGVTNSKTVGRNGPAILHSRSQTRFTATKQVVFTPGRGFEAQPAQVDADTLTVTDDIQSTRGGWLGRLVVRRAWKKVAENKPLSTEIARQRAMAHIAEAFDRKIDDLLVEWNRAADLRETLAVLRDGDGSPGYCCRSTKDYVEFALAGDPAIGAKAFAPPNLADFDAPIQLWVHRSLVPTRLLPAVTQLQATRSSVDDFFTRLSRVAPVSLPWQATAVAAAPPRTNAVAYQFVDDWSVISWSPQEESKSLVAQSSDLERR